MQVPVILISLCAAVTLATAANAAPEPSTPISTSTPYTLPASVQRPVLNQKAMDKLGWKLSCQAYTFREMSLSETVDVLQALGIRYIELYPGQRYSKENSANFDHNSSPEMIDAMKRKLKSAGITPVNYGVVGLDNDEASARKVFDFAKRMGLKTIVSEPSEDAFPMLDRLTKEYGISIAIHNHPQPSHYWNPDTVLKVTNGLSNRIGSCSDTGHWYRSGLLPLDCLKKLRGRIISLHFKDLSEQKHDVPWGTGVLNADAMLAEIKSQGIKPVFSIEYESTSGAELISNVAKCCQYFSDTATRLAKAK